MEEAISSQCLSLLLAFHLAWVQAMALLSIKAFPEQVGLTEALPKA